MDLLKHWEQTLEEAQKAVEVAQRRVDQLRKIAHGLVELFEENDVNHPEIQEKNFPR